MAREPASIRTKNPGAMWGNKLAIKWGAEKKAVMLNDGKGQGNNIAVFPTFMQGICAQLDLWRTSAYYRNKKFKDAIKIWCGGNNVPSYIKYVKDRVPGITEDTVMNDAFWQSAMGVAFLKAQAGHEAGRIYPAPDQDWLEARSRVLAVPLPKPMSTSKKATAAGTVTVAASAGASAAADQGLDWTVIGLCAVALVVVIGVAIWAIRKYRMRHDTPHPELMKETNDGL